MASFDGETMLLSTAPQPSVRLGEEQEEGKKKEEEERSVLLESVRNELKETLRKVRRNRTEGDKLMLENCKITFMQTMEKAWLSNVIIKDRYLRWRVKAGPHTPDPQGVLLLHKTMDVSRQIRRAMSLGLEGFMSGLLSNSNKRKREDEEEEEEEVLEELKDFKKSNQELIRRMGPEHKERLAKTFKYYYRRARRFAKLESREEHLASIVNSLLERETQTETERETTENEILGYMLLQVTVESSLDFPHFFVLGHPSVNPPSNSLTLSSIPLVEPGPGDDRIVFEIPLRLFPEHVKSNFHHTSSVSKFDPDLTTDIEEIKRHVSTGRALIHKSKECLEAFRKDLTQLAAQRPFETKLITHYDDLFDIWLARCRNPLSQTETQLLNQIRRLAIKALDNYKHPLPTITNPIFPSLRFPYS